MSKFDVAGDGVPKAHGRIFKLDCWPVDKNSHHLRTQNETGWFYIILNYEIREDEVKKIERIEGVDTARKCGKYKISVTIGELFKDTKVISEVTSMMEKITDDHDRLIDDETLQKAHDKLKIGIARVEAERRRALEERRDLRMRQYEQLQEMREEVERDEDPTVEPSNGAPPIAPLQIQDETFRRIFTDLNTEDRPSIPFYGDIGHYDGSQGPR